MDYVTVKLHTDTRRLLRLIAAQTGEQMVQVMHRLCEHEWSEISDRNTERNTNTADRDDTGKTRK